MKQIDSETVKLNCARDVQLKMNSRMMVEISLFLRGLVRAI